MDIEKLKEKLDNLEMGILKVLSLIETTADSCELQEYTNQETCLRYAIKNQNELLDDMDEINFMLYK